jgi:predicted nuclease of restriction endonuclease-like (RecB) superfamily
MRRSGTLRNPLLLEFLGLKDEYSETELEDALILHLETFLLELGNEFAFVGRQKRLRIGHEWFRWTCCNFTGDCDPSSSSISRLGSSSVQTLD